MRAKTTPLAGQILFFLAVLMGMLVCPKAQSQTASTWSGGAGNWSDCPPSGNALWDTCNDTPPVFPNGNFDAAINGGPVTATSASIVNLSIGAGGSLLFAPSTSGILSITGTNIQNNGSISIDSSNGLIIQGPTSLTISGTGSISVGGSRFTASGFPTVTTQQKIQGNGAFSLGMNLVNQSTINATGGTLTMQPSSVVNTGTFEASSGAILSFSPGGPVSFNNTGGTIKALSGGIVQLFGSTYTGGTLTTAGTGVIQTSGDAVLNSLTNTGIIQAENTTVFQGTITNSGTIENASGTIGMSGSVTLAGSGSVIMSGSSVLNEFTGSDSLTSKQLIHGSGTIYQLLLTNQGTVSADSKGNTLFLSGGTTNNSATMEATNGGILELSSVVNNTGGTIEALNGSTAIFTSNFHGSINGGTLTTSGTGVIESQNGLLDGTVNVPTNAGKLNVDNFDLFIQGTIANTGTINLIGNSCISLNQPSTLTGTGKLVMASTTCIDGSGLPFTNQSTIEGSGSIGDSNPMPITNTGSIIASGASGLVIHPNPTGFTNSGKLIASSGSTLTVESPFNNLSSMGTLSGGTYSVTGTLGLPGSIRSNNGNITLTGASAEILNTGTLTNALASLSNIATKGSVSLQNGQVLTTTAGLATAGKISVGTGSGFGVGGNCQQTAGIITVDGTFTAASMILQKGSLVGRGTIVAAISSNAAITAGDSSTKPGKLSISGSYTNQASGSLNIFVGGTAAGLFGDLAVSNGVSLGGTLDIKLINGFVPAIGNTFTILTGSAITGQFATVNGTSINSSEHFEVNYSGTAVTLEVVAGP